MVGLIKTIIGSLCIVIILRHIINKTETRLFHTDANELLFDDNKIKELERNFFKK